MDSETISKKKRRRSPSSEESSDRSHSRSRSRSRSRSERKKSKKSKKQKSSKSKSEKKEKSRKQTKSKKDTKKKDRRRSRSRSESSAHREIKKPPHQQIPMEMPFNPYLMYQKFMMPRDPRLMFPMGGFNRMGFQPGSMGAPMSPQVKPAEPVQIEQPMDKIVKDQNFLNSDEKLFESIIKNEMSVKSVFELTQVSEYLAGPYLYKVVKRILNDPPNASLENLSKSLNAAVSGFSENNSLSNVNCNLNASAATANINNNFKANGNNDIIQNSNTSNEAAKNLCSNNTCANANCGDGNANNCSLMHSIALNPQLGQDGLSSLNANLSFAPKSNEILKYSVESFIYENTRKKCIDMGDMSSIREALYKYRNRHLSDELNQLL